MSWINEVDIADADEQLKPIYDDLIKSRGKISNILKVHSLNPQALQTHLDLYMTIMFGKSGLSRKERECIAVVVSRADNCEYCVNHHAESLARYIKDEKLLEQIKQDYRQASIPPKLMAICDYSYKLTAKPGVQKQEDIKYLQSFGLSDKDILDITLVVAYFNFVNRIALGLGVTFNAEELSGYKDEPSDK
ncbi:MAG: peroxidase-related enzyme [Alcanivoracaceae bacterium]|nr:peroxidase-related enzyme [Alcanivoracaceae bacterium]